MAGRRLISTEGIRGSGRHRPAIWSGILIAAGDSGSWQQQNCDGKALFAATGPRQTLWRRNCWFPADVRADDMVETGDSLVLLNGERWCLAENAAVCGSSAAAECLSPLVFCRWVLRSVVPSLLCGTVYHSFRYWRLGRRNRFRLVTEFRYGAD